MASTGKLIIHGLTKNGDKFRPSDWAERLCGSVATYSPSRRMTFHPNVNLASIGGIKCVIIDAELREENEMLFEFLTDFAEENNLKVMQTTNTSPSLDPS